MKGAIYASTHNNIVNIWGDLRWRDFLSSGCHFFSTLTANYGPLLIFSTAFDWLPSSIMSSAPEINKFSTRHPKSTPKVPLNMGPENT